MFFLIIIIYFSFDLQDIPDSVLGSLLEGARELSWVLGVEPASAMYKASAQSPVLSLQLSL